MLPLSRSVLPAFLLSGAAEPLMPCGVTGHKPVPRGMDLQPMLEAAYSLLRIALVCFAADIAFPTMTYAQTATGGIDQLKRQEASVRQVCAQVLPAVVSVNGASGVIISADGLVLSQYHVTHIPPNGFYGDRLDPGETAKVVFVDEREAAATLLGADLACDLSLVRLNEPGNYPFVPLNADAAVDLGDWVIKLGHPGGYSRGRTPVARLGRVICQIDTDLVAEFISDCDLNGGDSGGPFFDLDGRLVGILGNGTTPPGVRLPQDMIPRVRSLWAATTARRIHLQVPGMTRGEFTPGFTREFPSIYASAKTLDVDQWRQGHNSVRRWQNVVQDAAKSVIKILDGDGQVALGTAVSSKGMVVTKASVLPESPTCVLPDGSMAPARILGMDAAFDIAVLKVDAQLQPVVWSDDAAPRQGSFLAAPTPAALPIAIGIVSVARREPVGPFRNKVVRIIRAAADPPEIAGITVEGRGLVVTSAGGNAARADIQPADELTQLGAIQIHNEHDLVVSVAGRFAGDKLTATVIRKNQTLSREIELASRANRTANSGPTRFPVMFEHDAPVNPEEYGGPVFDLDGRAMGVTICGVGGYGCAAIPSDRVKRIVAEHAGDD